MSKLDRTTIARAGRRLLLLAALGTALPAAGQPKPATPAATPPAKQAPSPKTAPSTSSAPVASSARPSPADPVARAKELYVKGIGFAKKGDWDAAHTSLSEAWALVQNVPIALNLGKAELETGRYKEAVEHLQFCVDRSVGDEQNGKLATEWIVEAQRLVSKVIVSVNVRGARIEVDGAEIGRQPLARPVLVNKGVHTIEARLGTASAKKDIDIAKSATIRVHLELPVLQGPLPPPPPPGGFFTPRNVVILGGGVVTLGLAALGASWGVQSMMQDTWNREHCPAMRPPLGEQCWAEHDAHRADLVRFSYGFFAGAAAAAIATGVFAGKTYLVQPTVSPTSLAIGVQGTF